MSAGIGVSIFAPSAYPLGGVADWLDYLTVGLEECGFVVTLCLASGCGHNVDEYLSRHPWSRVQVVANPTGSAEGRVRALVAAMRITEPDLLVSVNLVDVYEAVRRLRLKGGRVSSSVAMALHGLQADLTEDIRREADVLDGVIATNRLSALLAAEALGDASRVHYAPYGVPGPNSAVGVRSVGSGLRLLYAGRIEQEQKRVLDLPPILSSLRASGVDARLSIAGGGPAEAELRHAFGVSGLAGAVDWLGDLDPARLADAYRSHDALLITSVWETGPIVAWEAMSHGLPVVSSRYIGSGLEGALIDGRTALLFEIGDIDGAVAAIQRLREPSVRDAVVSGGLALIRERYSREASVAAWERALRAIMTAPPKPPGPPRLSKPAGRLDRWFGVERAEDIRRRLGIRFVPGSPGAAWPHSRSSSAGQPEFLARARKVDRGEVVPVSTHVVARHWDLTE
jgi:glycosyltransferase involved in cell wall biosynthesis